MLSTIALVTNSFQCIPLRPSVEDVNPSTPSKMILKSPYNPYVSFFVDYFSFFQLE